jgi:hypothetical protein
MDPAPPNTYRYPRDPPQDPFPEFSALARRIPALDELLDEVRAYAMINIAPEAAWYGTRGTRASIHEVLERAALDGVQLPPEVISWSRAELVCVDRMIIEVLGRPAAIARTWGGIH